VNSNPETQRREPFLIAATRDLDEKLCLCKERRLVEEIKASLELGRKVQVYAVYTQKRDVTRRLEEHPGERRHPGSRASRPWWRRKSGEAWYERQLRAGFR